MTVSQGASRLIRRCVRPALVLPLGAALAAPVHQTVPRGASAPAPAQGAPSTAPSDTATVVMWRRPIVTFRSSLGARGAVERAADAARRIEAIVDSESTDSVTLRAIPEGMLVTVGARAVFTITPADIDTAHGETLISVSDGAADHLRMALGVAREERSIPHLVWAAGLAIVATLVFLLVLRLLRGARRVLVAKVPFANRRLGTIALGGFTLVSKDSLLLFVRRLADLGILAVGLFVAYLWLAFVLTRFAYTRPWGDALGTYLSTTVAELALTAVSGIPGLFTVVLILVATRWFARVVIAFFDAVEAGSVEVPWIHPETANPTKRIAVALLWLFAIVVAYPYIPGSTSSAFKGVSVFAGLVLSIGSSGIMNQAMSGLVLMYSRALKPGDYVRVADTEGTVTALGMLSTKVRTTKREEVTVPNAVVVAATVKNYSRLSADAGVIVYTGVTIGYDTPWRQVEGLLLLAAGRTEGLRAEPAPFVLKQSLGDFYVEYQLNAALERPEERVRVLDRLHGHILDSFNEYGVQITSPHYEADPDRPKLVPRDQWFAAPTAGEAPPSRTGGLGPRDRTPSA